MVGFIAIAISPSSILLIATVLSMLSLLLLVAVNLYVPFCVTSYVAVAVVVPLAYVLLVPSGSWMLFIPLCAFAVAVICEQLLNLNSLFTLAIRNVGEIVYNKEVSFATFINELNSFITISGNSFNLFSVDGIIKSFISIGLFNLIFSYSLRYILIKVFTLLCPFAFLCLINNKTKWIFSSWLRIILSLLLLQIFISLILLVCFSFTYSSNILSKIIYIGCVYALMKANTIIKEFIGGVSTVTGSPISSLKSLLGGK